MIPISDDPGPRRLFPLVNTAIILANIAVFVYEFTLSQGQLNNFVQRYAIVPADITRYFWRPDEWLTIFTSMFLHGGLLHIGGNMLFLYIFGDNVEDAMGHFRYLLFYLIAGVLAAALQIGVHPTSFVPVVGASGAIAGVLGAYLILFPGARVKTLILIGIIPVFPTFAAIVVIGVWAITQFLAGFATYGSRLDAGGVAYFAHIGGFIAGLVLARLFAANLANARRHIPHYGQY